MLLLELHRRKREKMKGTEKNIKCGKAQFCEHIFLTDHTHSTDTYTEQRKVLGQKLEIGERKNLTVLSPSTKQKAGVGWHFRRTRLIYYYVTAN